MKRPSGLFFLCGKGMQLVKLKEEFFAANTHLVEVLDKDHEGRWDKAKVRGYGIAVVQISGGLTFGIPLRSHIHHNECYRTNDKKGLDYSKAVLIADDSHIGDPFRIPTDEYIKLADHEHFITGRFEKYVLGYIKALQKNDENILRRYKYSTLQNYHHQLGIGAKED
ncbi:type III toxin-antitoxin system TenpIN family toxin [Cereibacter johrii]|uniref:type III toxin-antitoxin system TenpIN family toxin n=1 Tax=Cereibacter johrii TaxID=445629 RepID=UPI003CF1C9CB